MKYLIWFILLAVAFFFVRKFLNRFKLVKGGSIMLFTGGVGTGKSSLAVATALSEYRSALRSWKIKKFWGKIFRKPPVEKPLIYSNIPLKCDYVPLTKDLIFREKRFAFGSIVYVNEASLLADSMLVKNMELNERLMLFNKLIRHETHNGVLIYDTQCVSDNHYTLKRALSNYIYIHHLTKWIPFVLVAHVREFTYSDDDTSVVNSINEDTEDSLKKVIFLKRVWKKFDSIGLSHLTDNLPVEDNVVKGKELPNLKVDKLVSFRDFRTLPSDFVYKIGDEVKNEKKKL